MKEGKESYVMWTRWYEKRGEGQEVSEHQRGLCRTVYTEYGANTIHESGEVILYPL